ncbi:hypothetical protein BC828DRAFT_408225 [Blastocladiella britannica]|nr:hypothetical protein BC828DRAFT_408225 [Blastocladiella britannica]
MSDHSTPDVAAAMGQLQLGEPSAPPPPPPPPPPPTPRPATALPSQLSSISSFTNVGFGVVSENRTDERKRAVLAQAANVSVADYHLKALKSSDRLLDPSDPRIKEDIIRLLSQYLTDEGFHVSKLTLQDESNVRIHEAADRHLDLRRLRKVILEGDWAEVDKLVLGSTQRVTALLGRQYKPFLYAVYKQQFLESIEHREVHKAFTFLQKRLKPLEAYQANADEFRDLCYLLTATSVHDVPAFRQWEGVGPGRERLAEQLQAMIDLESVDRDVYVPPNRLLTLLKQAVAYQVVYSRYHPKVPPRVHTYVL